MRIIITLLLAGLMFATLSATANADPPDGPAEDTPASCGGVAYSDHATGNSHDEKTQREVIREVLPSYDYFGLGRGGFFSTFAQLHYDTHEGCEEALLGG